MGPDSTFNILDEMRKIAISFKIPGEMNTAINSEKLEE